MPPTRKLCRCGFLPQDRVHLDELALPLQRLEVVSDGHEIRLGG
jgi:hypothetical protein